DLPSPVKQRMAAGAAIYQRVIYQQQASRSFLPAQGDFQLRSWMESTILDPTHPQLLEPLADDAPDIWELLRGQSVSAVGTRNVLRFLGSGYGSSERYALVLRHRHEI